MDITGKIIQWETEGFEKDEDVVVFFQELVDTGLAWTLQGSYGRIAKALIDAGKITERRTT